MDKKTPENCSAQRFRTMGLTPSGPDALFGFILFSTLYISPSFQTIHSFTHMNILFSVFFSLLYFVLKIMPIEPYIKLVSTITILKNFAFSVLQSFFLLGPVITFIPYQTRFILLLSKKYFLSFFFRLRNSTSDE